MNRRRDDLQLVDTSTWPTVDVNALPVAMKKTFEARRQAIDWYIENKPLRDIERRTGINSRQLYRLIDRCMRLAEDGLVVGFRGLLQHRRVGAYTRTANLSAESSVTGKGLAGAFTLLLERYPVLVAWLKQKIRERAVNLRQISTDGKLKIRLQQLGKLHAGFILQCRAVGITAADYPFNTD